MPGVMIFGDIKNYNLWKVQYGNGAFFLEHVPGKLSKLWLSNFYKEVQESSTVIGNIYENQNLLKES